MNLERFWWIFVELYAQSNDSHVAFERFWINVWSLELGKSDPKSRGAIDKKCIAYVITKRLYCSFCSSPTFSWSFELKVVGWNPENNFWPVLDPHEKHSKYDRFWTVQLRLCGEPQSEMKRQLLTTKSGSSSFRCQKSMWVSSPKATALVINGYRLICNPFRRASYLKYGFSLRYFMILNKLVELYSICSKQRLQALRCDSPCRLPRQILPSLEARNHTRVNSELTCNYLMSLVPKR